MISLILLAAAMRKNLNRKNSAPPAGTYNPSNPCETEEIVADVLANTQQQVREVDLWMLLNL